VSHRPWLEVKPAIRASMRANRSKNTKPERGLGELLTLAGYRFKSHVETLPGRPDFVFSRRRCVVFVHGCFWHQHKNCKRSHIPLNRIEYWDNKLARNKKNDLRARRALKHSQWRVLIVWECQLRDSERLLRRLYRFLGPPRALRKR
jgi:DNA mismatch endonuclease (patch repair protein)